MTKQEELKVLEKIQKLINDAGTDSYIMMTFNGVVDVCRTNIENDWGDNPVENWESYEEKYHKAEAKVEAMEREYDDLLVAHKDVVDKLNGDIDALNKRLGDKAAALVEFKDEMSEFHREMATFIDEAVAFYRSGQKRHELYGRTATASFKRGAADALEDFKGLFFE